MARWVVQNNLDGMDFDLENFGSEFGFGGISPLLSSPTSPLFISFTYVSFSSLFLFSLPFFLLPLGLSTTQMVQWVADATNGARGILGSSRIITHAPQPPYFGTLPLFPSLSLPSPPSSCLFSPFIVYYPLFQLLATMLTYHQVTTDGLMDTERSTLYDPILFSPLSCSPLSFSSLFHSFLFIFFSLLFFCILTNPLKSAFTSYRLVPRAVLQQWSNHHLRDGIFPLPSPFSPLLFFFSFPLLLCTLQPLCQLMTSPDLHEQS